MAKSLVAIVKGNRTTEMTKTALELVAAKEIIKPEDNEEKLLNKGIQ